MSLSTTRSSVRSCLEILGNSGFRLGDRSKGFFLLYLEALTYLSPFSGEDKALMLLTSAKASFDLPNVIYLLSSIACEILSSACSDNSGAGFEADLSQEFSACNSSICFCNFARADYTTGSALFTAALTMLLLSSPSSLRSAAEVCFFLSRRSMSWS